jgi:very-short-patch-repair endonuclease
VRASVTELLAAEGRALRRCDHPELRHEFDRCLKRGELIPALRGVYTAPDPDIQALVLAAALDDPDCVVVGAAAARLLWRPMATVERVEVAVARPRRGWHRYLARQRVVPPELIVERGPVRIACPELSVLDLLPSLGGDIIDEALRLRKVTLDGLWKAFQLTPGRRGNALRRDLLHDSRDLPWSEAEREVHRAPRAAGVTGWVTNHRVAVSGRTYVADIAFPEVRLIVEIDGKQFHNNPEAFVYDRWRWSRLTAAGWRVLVFPASASHEPEEMIQLIQETLAG